MEKYRIDHVEEKQSAAGKPYWLVHYNGDQKASIAPFSKSLADYISNRKGEMIELEIKRNGDYMNVVGAEGFHEDDPQPPGKYSSPPRKAGGFGGGKADPKKLESIERQATAKMVLAYYGAMKIEMTQEKFIKTADFVAKWIAND